MAKRSDVSSTGPILTNIVANVDIVDSICFVNLRSASVCFIEPVLKAQV